MTNRRVRRRCCRQWALFAATVAAASLAIPHQSRAVTFNFIPAQGMSQQPIDGFTAAGVRWSSLLADDVTVNINIDFAPLGAGVLGSASSTSALYTYTGTRAALVDDATTSDDATATSFLQPPPAAGMLINYTSNNPNGSASLTPYFDNNGSGNNTNVRMHHANAKSLGLRSVNNPATDASIAFNSTLSWDFDPYDGIAAGAYDFVGTATHEIAHALGFSSGVDLLDTSSPNGSGNFFPEDSFNPKALDLFRYSSQSVSQGAGVFDISADARTKYFSIDGGATNLAEFSTGRLKGDGQQAGHWKDNLNLGVMDPTAPTGATLFISELDRQALDVIGFDPGNRWLWVDPAGGDFSSAIRWSSTAVPQAGQIAVWNIDATYAIAFMSLHATAAAEVRGGNVTFNLGGQTYDAGATFDLAPAAGDDATLNIAGGTLTAASVNLAGATAAPGGTGVLSVDAGATLSAPDVIRIWPGGTLKYNGGVVSSSQILLAGGTIRAVNGVTSAIPINTTGGAIRVDDATHELTGPLTTTAGGTLTKTGAGTLVIAGPQAHAAGAVLHVAAGTTTLATNAGEPSSPGTLAVVADATTNFASTQNLASLAIGAGATVTLAEGATRSIKTSALDIDTAAGAALDLKDNRLIVDYAGSSTVADVLDLLAAGHNAGTWDGPGINSSLAGDSGLYALGYGEASDVLAVGEFETAAWGDQTVDATAVLVRYTYGGDANLDGAISGDDYSAIDFSIAVPGASGWYNGDFNYDGIISGDDYSVIDFNIVAQGPPLGASSTITAVPEPAACLFAIPAAMTLRRRRRRR